MTWIDWGIVIVLAGSVLTGFQQGILRSVCSLGGLFCGLVIAAWNYPRIAGLLLPVLRIEAIADAIGFLLIAFFVMALANFVGVVLSKTLHGIGLGCLDKLAGAAFGLLQGALIVTLCILVVVAFFPKVHWLADARLPKYFFGVCHMSTHLSPAELADRVRNGLLLMEQHVPKWMHPPTA